MARYAFLPARGGSKRIPRKNIRDFAGKPMIQWPIEALLSSNMFDEIFVSSDDHEILELAEKLGVRPVERSTDLSGDFVGVLDVAKDLINTREKTFNETDIFACVFPTATSLSVERIEEALRLIETNPNHMVVAVKKFQHPIVRALAVSGDFMVMEEKSSYKTRTQDSDERFYDAGFLYFGYVDKWVESLSILSEPFTPLLLSPTEGVDIDNFEDLKLAEQLHEIRH